MKKLKKEIELEIVTFEQAKGLFKIGFPQGHLYTDKYFYALTEHMSYVDNEGDMVVREGELIDSVYDSVWILDDYTISAPTLSLVAKWLRDEMHLSICPMRYCPPMFGRCESKYKLQIVLPHSFYDEDPDGYDSILGDTNEYDSYEEALSSGIDTVIKIICAKNGECK